MEKTIQLQLMSQIFSNAENVLVWLGEEGDDSHYALKLLERMAQLMDARIFWRLLDVNTSRHTMSSLRLKTNAAILRGWLHKSAFALLSTSVRDNNLSNILSPAHIYGDRGIKTILKLVQRP